MSESTSRALPFHMFVLSSHVAHSIPSTQTNKLHLYTEYIYIYICSFGGGIFFLTIFNLHNLPKFSTFINDSFTSATSSWMH